MELYKTWSGKEDMLSALAAGVANGFADDNTHFFSLCLADIPGHLGICTSVNIEDKLNF